MSETVCLSATRFPRISFVNQRTRSEYRITAWVPLITISQWPPRKGWCCEVVINGTHANDLTVGSPAQWAGSAECLWPKIQYPCTRHLLLGYYVYLDIENKGVGS